MPNAFPLRDAHLHLAALGEELSCVHLADCASQDECLQRLASAAQTAPAGAWIKAVGARVEAWQGDPWPTAQQITTAVGDRPAAIFSFDHHALVANTAALRAAGITRHSPATDPARGVIQRNPATREPTGLLLEEACHAIYRAFPAPTDEQFLAHIRAAQTELTRLGFIEAHDMLATPRLANALLNLERNGELHISLRLYATREDFNALLPDAHTFEKSSKVRLAGLKIFTDGTLNSRTAHMLTPYADPLPDYPHGKALMTGGVGGEIEESVRYADSHGYPIAAHAIGDAAVRSTLDAIERAAPATLNQRIEHAQFVDESDIPRFASLGVIVSPQPCHLLTDIEAINRLMPHRAHRAFPMRDFINAATSAGFDPADIIYLGSDAPIVPADPSDNIQAAVHRRRADMPESQSIAPEQSITTEEALALMQCR